MIRNDFNFLLFSLTRQIRSLVKQKTKTSPLTFEQIRALSYISRFEGLSQKELAELLESKTMATSKLIDALESISMVKRERDQVDRRAFKLYLTEKGTNGMKAILQLSEEVYQQITNGIDEQEINAFQHTIEKIQKNL